MLYSKSLLSFIYKTVVIVKKLFFKNRKGIMINTKIKISAARWRIEEDRRIFKTIKLLIPVETTLLELGENLKELFSLPNTTKYALQTFVFIIENNHYAISISGTKLFHGDSYDRNTIEKNDKIALHYFSSTNLDIEFIWIEEPLLINSSCKDMITLNLYSYSILEFFDKLSKNPYTEYTKKELLSQFRNYISAIDKKNEYEMNKFSSKSKLTTALCNFNPLKHIKKYKEEHELNVLYDRYHSINYVGIFLFLSAQKQFDEFFGHYSADIDKLTNTTIDIFIERKNHRISNGFDIISKFLSTDFDVILPCILLWDRSIGISSYISIPIDQLENSRIFQILQYLVKELKTDKQLVEIGKSIANILIREKFKKYSNIYIIENQIAKSIINIENNNHEDK